MSRPPEASVRSAVVAATRRLADAGLNRGTSGNVSARVDPERFLITPSGVRPGELTEDDLVSMRIASDSGSVEGASVGRASIGPATRESGPLEPDSTNPWPVEPASLEPESIQPDATGAQPSSEWRLHQGILGARPDVNVVVHTHSVHATALACLGRRIPAFHYMVAVAGGDSIECAPYARFGTQELADAAVMALEGRSACLLAHHGVVALGRDADEAVDRALEVEGLAEMYLACLAVEEPPTLSADQMAEVHRRFATYGTQATGRKAAGTQGSEPGTTGPNTSELRTARR